MKNYYFANCPLNFEDLLHQELEEMGAVVTKRVLAGLFFEAKHEEDNSQLLYRVLVNSRLASSVELVLTQFEAEERHDFLQKAKTQVNWTTYIESEQFFACEANQIKKSFAPENFFVLLTKDAIVDAFKEANLARPNVDRLRCDHLISLHIDGAQFTLSLKLGRSLHRRGLRNAYKAKNLIKKSHDAPIKENVAAALLMRANWPEVARTGGDFVDPMCGSGTFLAEAYMMATCKAVNAERVDFGCEHWHEYNAEQLNYEKNLAEERYQQHKTISNHFYGYDLSPYSIKQTEAAMEKLGVDLAQYTVEVADIFAFEQDFTAKKGLLVTNPPYGQRLSSGSEVVKIYHQLGLLLKERFINWFVAIILAEESQLLNLNVRSDRLNSFYNGRDRRYLARFLVENPRDKKVTTLSESATQLKNRLEKRFKILAKKAQKVWQTNAYRLYDADLPEYNIACDIYDCYAVVQEYKAPSTIDKALSEQRFKEFLRVLAEVTQLSRGAIIVKLRHRQGLTGQYQKNEATKPLEHYITENNAHYLVTLNSYVDVGFYLDHRFLRRHITASVADKTFLNLFSYTGSMSIAALKGGAKMVTSVDSSRTYLDYYERNLQENKLDSTKAVLERKDIRDFLYQSHQRWDIIYLDPPTFSNSKMRQAFDLQKDHVTLINLVMRKLNRGGKLYFSTHFRKFKMDATIFEDYNVEDWTNKSLDEDFARYAIHQLWVIEEQ